MVTKKKEAVKNIVIKNVKEPISKGIPEKYKAVFPRYIIITEVKYDLNWIAIRRKIQSINIFKVVKEVHKENYRVEPSDIKKIFVNAWKEYCYLFDFYINKKIQAENLSDMDIEEIEELKKIGEQIKEVK